MLLAYHVGLTLLVNTAPWVLFVIVLHDSSEQSGSAIYARFFSGVKQNTQDLCQESTLTVDTVLGLLNDNPASL